MKINLIIKDNRITGYQTFPLDEKLPLVELEEIPQDLTDGEYAYMNNQILKVGLSSTKQQELEFNKKQNLRDKRISLLEAFDKYRSAVSYGLVIETQEERTEIINWYNKLLNLDEIAFKTNVIPKKIAYYL